mgnify:CR=1 FL=1|tara:strand:+ start:5 stop:541 length:537 start_codon:yes stop_codon:yes gene_type:complete
MALTKITGSGLGASKILQVKSTVKSNTQSIVGTTFADVISVSITPTSSSSTILIMCDLNITCGLSDANTTGARYSGVKLYRGSTQIGVNSDISGTQSAVWFSVQSTETSNSGFQQKNSSGSFVDSPSSTSAITYKIQAGNTYNNAHYTYINRPSYGAGDSQTYVHKGVSTLTVMEISA